VLSITNDGEVVFQNQTITPSGLKRGKAKVRKIEFNELVQKAQKAQPSIDPMYYAFAELRTSVEGSPGVHTTETGDQWRKDQEYKYRPMIVRGTEYDHGLYWQLFLDSGQYRRAITGHKTKLVGSSWRIERAHVDDNATEEQKNLAKRQAAWVESAVLKSSGWVQYLEEITFMFVSGNSIHIPQFYPADHEEKPCQIKEFHFRYTHTVDGWVEDENGRMLGINFKDPNARMDQGEYFVPAEDLAFLRYDAFGNDWEGNSPLRSVGRWILAKILFAKLEALAYEKYGIPLLTAEWNESVTIQTFSTPEDDDQLASVLDAFVAVDRAVIDVPWGRKIVLHSPQGAVPNFDPIKRYCDEQIHSILMDELSLMGTRNSPGSFNLSETKANEKQGFIPFIAAKICAEFNGDHNALHGQIIPKMVDAAVEAGIFEDHVRDLNGQISYPRLEHSMSEERQSAEKTNQLAAAVSAGLITWTPQDEMAQRQQLGLPALTADEIDRLRKEREAAMMEQMQGSNDPDDEDEDGDNNDGPDPTEE
jgi:hypothetical protein